MGPEHESKYTDSERIELDERLYIVNPNSSYKPPLRERKRAALNKSGMGVSFGSGYVNNVITSDVAVNSVADHGGVRPGDVLRKINDVAIENVMQLLEIVF